MPHPRFELVQLVTGMITSRCRIPRRSVVGGSVSTFQKRRRSGLPRGAATASVLGMATAAHCRPPQPVVRSRVRSPSATVPDVDVRVAEVAGGHGLDVTLEVPVAAADRMSAGVVVFRCVLGAVRSWDSPLGCLLSILYQRRSACLSVAWVAAPRTVRPSGRRRSSTTEASEQRAPLPARSRERHCPCHRPVRVAGVSRPGRATPRSGPGRSALLRWAIWWHGEQSPAVVQMASASSSNASSSRCWAGASVAMS